MALNSRTKLTRVAVFYDGNFFLHVSNYYAFNHPKQSRISIRGLHEFIRHQVAEFEGEDVRRSQIVDAHFFRGRLPALEAQQRGNLLYYERVFDDILMWEGVITHYLPLRNSGGRREEKGIDVWMALEAYELCLMKSIDVVVLISADGDYVPLVRKLNTLGTRVMVLSWDFEFTDQEGNRIVTRTSQELLEEVTYPVAMHELIENRARKNDPLIQSLFVERKIHDEKQRGAGDGRFMDTGRTYSTTDEDDEGTHVEDLPLQGTEVVGPTKTLARPEPKIQPTINDERYTSEILSLKNGYGFIRYPNNNLFFHHSDLLNADFLEVREGDPVEFGLGLNKEGDYVAKNVKVLFDEEE